jgi:hypothetical protein
LAWEDPINREFVTSQPKRPRLGNKEKKVQNKRFALGFKVARMLSHSCLELGDQFTLNMSLSPLHKNWARQQLKKI